MAKITATQEAIILQHWQNRLTNFGMLTAGKTQKYQKMQAEFFAGAMSALDACGIDLPPFWTIAAMTGRSILDEKKKDLTPLAEVV